MELPVTIGVDNQIDSMLLLLLLLMLPLIMMMLMLTTATGRRCGQNVITEAPPP